MISGDDVTLSAIAFEDDTGGCISRNDVVADGYVSCVTEVESSIGAARQSDSVLVGEGCHAVGSGAEVTVADVSAVGSEHQDGVLKSADAETFDGVAGRGHAETRHETHIATVDHNFWPSRVGVADIGSLGSGIDGNIASDEQVGEF